MTHSARTRKPTADLKQRRGRPGNFIAYRSVAPALLAGLLLSGCATVSDKQRLAARLQHQCVTQHFDRLDSAATFSGAFAGMHRACAQWAAKQVRGMPH